VTGTAAEPGFRTARSDFDLAYEEMASFFDAFAADEQRWRQKNRGYYQLLEQIYRFHIPAGARVLEIGSGSGDLLAALQPRRGVGVDVSGRLVALARERHPELEFVRAAGEDLDLGETFDYVVLSDLVPFVHDLIALFEAIRRHSHQGTRVVVNSYSRVWRPAISAAEQLGLKPRKPIRNWVTQDDVENLLGLVGFETISTASRILMPKRIPFLSTFLNGFVGSLWPFYHLSVGYWLVARLLPAGGDDELSVSVVCPCRNEQGHIPALVQRLPEFGSQLELVFVEGNSTDDTRGEIERQIEAHPERNLRMVPQPGRGKGDAVRAGFAEAQNDVLMILDGDLSVAPEELPKFYAAIREGRAELVNGSRLVYDVEPGAMRFLNLVGNKTFSRLFKATTGQRVKDTLCGTKVLRRSDYERISRGRDYFGDFDPFGDFDLLFGGSRLGLKIVDLPVRYQPRTYGETNISRWRHGVLLLRMTLFAFWKFKVDLFRGR
jgi:SAM-dependent methyltransferase